MASFEDIARRRRRTLSSSPWGYQDEDTEQMSLLESQKRSYSHLKWQAEQAAARGLIEHKDLDEVARGDRSSLIQKALGLANPNNTGGVLETLGDVLFLGNYAGGAATMATVRDPKVELSIGGIADLGKEADVFGLGEYIGKGPLLEATEAVSDWYEARYHTPLTVNLGFTTDAFSKAWRHKTDFIKVFDETGASDSPFAAGLTADILLDPLTYLSLGVSAGAKVTATAGIKGALSTTARTAAIRGAEEGAQLTLTRFGTNIFRMAERELLGRMRDNLTVRAGTNAMTKETAQAFYQNAAEHMVVNFDRLKAQYLAEAKNGLWKGAKSIIAPASEANRARVIQLLERKGKHIAGMGIDDLFQESASFLGKERGLFSSTAAQMQLAGKEALELGTVKGAALGGLLGTAAGPVGTVGGAALGAYIGSKKLFKMPAAPAKVFEKLFDVFDRGWDAPADVMMKLRASQTAADLALQTHRAEAREVFKFLSPADRTNVARAVELRAAAELGHALPGAEVRYSDDAERAIEFFKSQMDDILAYEVKHGFNTTNRVEGYVSHIYNANVRKYILDTLAKNGEEIVGYGANRFTQQRLIASIAEGENMFGKGALQTDAWLILDARRRASLQMVHLDEWYRQVANEHGIARMLLADQAKGMSKSIIRSWARRAGYGVQEVLRANQVYRAEHGNLTRLGFKDPGVGGSLRSHRETLEYLRRPNDDLPRTAERPAGKYSPDGKAQADRLRLPEAARTHFIGGEVSRPLPSRIKFAPLRYSELDVRAGAASGGRVKFPIRKDAGGKKLPLEELDVDTLFRMLDDAEHPAWGQVLRSSVAGEQTQLSRLNGVMTGLHNYAVRYLDSSLVGMVPDVEERLLAAWRAWDPAAKKPVKPPSTRPPKPGATPKPTPKGPEQRAKEQLARLVSKLGGPIEVRKVVPQLPPTLIAYAQATRAAAGITSDVRPVTQHVKDRVELLYAQLGFTADLQREYNLLVFGNETLRTHADGLRILDNLEPLAQQGKNVLDPKKIVLPKHIGENFKTVKLRLTRKTEGNLYPEVYDQNLALPVAPGDVNGGSTLGNVLHQERGAALKAGELPPEVMRVADRPGVATEAIEGSIGGRGERPAQIFGSRAPGEAVVTRVGAGDLRKTSPMPADRSLGKVGPGTVEEGGLQSRIPGKLGEQGKFFETKRRHVEILRRQLQEAKEAANKLLPPNYQALVRAVEKSKTALKEARELRAETLEAWRGNTKNRALRTAKDQAAKDLKTARQANKDAVATLRQHDGAMEKYKPAKAKVEELRAKVKGAVVRLRQTGGREGEALGAHELAQDQAILQSQRATAKGGGVVKPGRMGAESFTPADELRTLRRQRSLEEQSLLASRVPPEEVAERLAPLDARLAELRAAVTRLPSELPSGLQRPTNKPVEIDLILPESIAKVIDDINKPNIDPALGETAKRILRTYDAITNFYKVNLLLPFGGFYSRNGLTNASMNFLRHGLGFLSPENNFERMRHTTAAIGYALGSYSDFPRTLGPIPTGKVSDWLRTLGDTRITAKNGASMTIRELDQEMRILGIYRGVVTSDLQSGLGGWGSARAAISGAFAGAAVGAGAAAVTGGDPTWTSVAAGAAGGLAGLRNLRKAKAGLGGIPVRGLNGVTGLLQSEWRPFARAGEAAAELPFRVSMFVQEFMEHGRVGEAAEQVYRHMSDYWNMSVFERRWMRRMVPFYAWTKQAWKATGYTLVENPGRLSSIFKTFRDWNEAHDADPEDVPDFLLNKLNMVVNFSKDEDYHTLAPGVLAVEDVATMTAGLVGGARRLGSVVVPGISAPARPGEVADDTKAFLQGIVGRGWFPAVTALEAVTNTDTFTGKSLEKAYGKADPWSEAPDWLKFLVAYQEPVKDDRGRTLKDASVNPMMAWALGEVPVSRFIYFTKMLRSTEPETRGQLNTSALARQLLGVSAYRVDPQTNRYFINRGRIEAMKNLLDHVLVEELGEPPSTGSRRRSRGRSWTPPSQRR